MQQNIQHIIHRLIWKKKGRIEILLASTGFLLGLLILCLIVQLFTDVEVFFGGNTGLKNQNDVLLINKKVGLGHMLYADLLQFSQNDVADIKARPFIRSIGFVLTNQFTSSARISFGDAHYSTELFFEAIPDEFLNDAFPDKATRDLWHTKNWQGMDDETVPVIISKEFLALYNLGFAPARGLPVITPETASLVPFELELSGSGGRRVFKARLAGFTESIASFLLPYSFMEWANRYIAQKKDMLSRRLILSVSDKFSPEITHFLKEKNYELSRVMLNISDIRQFIQLFLGMVAFLALVFILLSTAIFILNMQVIIAHASRDIRLLWELGYKKSDLLMSLLFVFLVPLGVGALAAFGLALWLIQSLHRWLFSLGFSQFFIPVPLLLAVTAGALFICLGLNTLLLSRRLTDTI